MPLSRRRAREIVRHALSLCLLFPEDVQASGKSAEEDPVGLLIALQREVADEIRSVVGRHKPRVVILAGDERKKRVQTSELNAIIARMADRFYLTFPGFDDKTNTGLPSERSNRSRRTPKT